MFVAAFFTSPKLGTIQMSTDRRTANDKSVQWNTDCNEVLTHDTTRLNLENIVLNETTQTQKHKYFRT